MVAHRGLFFDRDGTLIVHRHYLHDPDGVELLPGAREMLEWATEAGYRLFLFTNQSGIGRGLFTLAQAEACNVRMFELLGARVRFAGTCVAPETPEQPQVYRKPSPRYIREMIAAHGLDPRETWMIGNSRSDVMAGVNAGVRAALVHGDAGLGDLPAEVVRCESLTALRAVLAAAPQSA
ncbi:D-glycero-alpha-D-manno-heptose-1,7-bisphosphate 7-phosphatase [Oleiharenicola sp. Vm1]|uniref:D-glycero-alpha-D-manno-heptose-1,7-bisphosphate 7-phosphatase n=1 Tax=Oleiharenicola sp. Vm1 TaxID=3398393 RepID=UPI0039F573FC